MASKDYLSSPASVDPSPASMKGKAAIIVIGPTTPPNKKEPTQPVDSYVSLDNLRFGMACIVRVMVCRKWESTDLNKPISTNYIISDEHGGAIHCTASSGIAHHFSTNLEEGKCCIIKGFTVKPNKERFHLRNDDKHCIHLEGTTMVKNLDYDASLFQRYPFQLTPLEDITLNGFRFLFGMDVFIDLDFSGRTRAHFHTNPSFNTVQM